MTQLSLKEAKRLSIVKWEAHVKAGGHCYELPSEVLILTCNCGFCERWNMECPMCEFGDATTICTEDSSLFSAWWDKRTVENAQAILYIVKSIEV